MSNYADIASRAKIAQPVETTPGHWDMFLNRSKKLVANVAAVSGAGMMFSFLPGGLMVTGLVKDAVDHGGMPFISSPSDAIIGGAIVGGCALVGIVGAKMLQHFQIRIHELNDDYKEMKALRRPSRHACNSRRSPEPN
jgi:hypothetical protein